MSEACARLSCTPRQLRYRIKKGEIAARKVDGRWQIDDRVLPADPAADRRERERAADLEQEVADGLAQRRARRRYSVEDLHAFTAVAGLAREATLRAPEHPAVRCLVDAAASIARGVHAYGGRDKAGAFTAARGRVADAVALLHVGPAEGTWALDLARRAEDVVLPALGGLIRRQDRRVA